VAAPGAGGVTDGSAVTARTPLHGLSAAATEVAEGQPRTVPTRYGLGYSVPAANGWRPSNGRTVPPPTSRRDDNVVGPSDWPDDFDEYPGQRTWLQ
jgi:hypothetical protein